jgi:hypothetical protein
MAATHQKDGVPESIFKDAEHFMLGGVGAAPVQRDQVFEVQGVLDHQWLVQSKDLL